jgi:hypothetical protein
MMMVDHGVDGGVAVVAMTGGAMCMLIVRGEQQVAERRMAAVVMAAVVMAAVASVELHN